MSNILKIKDVIALRADKLLAVASVNVKSKCKLKHLCKRKCPQKGNQNKVFVSVYMLSATVYEVQASGVAQ